MTDGQTLGWRAHKEGSAANPVRTIADLEIVQNTHCPKIKMSQTLNLYAWDAQTLDLAGSP
jgi:hypothetical protein